RNVSNKDSEKALSALSSKIYKKIEARKDNSEIIEKFKATLTETDKELDIVYKEIFEDVIQDVKKFGGIRQDDSVIKIISSLKHKELLEENTTVMYELKTPGHSLPESYNGLGYMNLISMIFEIKILLHDFQKEINESPSDINLLFIEEPEAHTHPQMQRVFINNIKSLLDRGISKEDGRKYNLQTILSTHSSHIVSESNFEDIKYLKRENNGIVSKNLKDLKNEYHGYEQNYKFLKQYLTLHRAELFFADKAVFIEGDTERILLPAIMKKIDQEDFIQEFSKGKIHSIPLLSQNISVIEVGAYSHVFEKFIDFIGIKSLIITDLDSGKTVTDTNETGTPIKNKDGTDKKKIEPCPVCDGSLTSNTSLRFFYGDDKNLNEFISMRLENKRLKKDPTSKKWIAHENGHLLCVYQTEETVDGKKYHARSFEDAFFHVNRSFIKDSSINKNMDFIGDISFPSLTKKKLRNFIENKINVWQIAEDVKSKPSFAMEILLSSKDKKITIKNNSTGEETTVVDEFSNWKIPKYIEEGLKWLKTD
ncbi:TPA: AAA family ATPase, partial [Legionella pneumophila]|nr:AAA family ATPase [Legionella pneumophila]